MIYRVRHTTRLSYAAPVANARFNLRLIPRPWDGHIVHEQALRIAPEPALCETSPGPYWVNTTRIAFADPLEQIEIASEFVIAIGAPPQPTDGPALAQVRSEALGVRDLSDRSPAPFLFASRIAGVNEEIAQWGAAQVAGASDILAAAQALTHAIKREFAYAPGATTSATPPEVAFAARAGVCQDFTHVMIIALRSLGIPAAYVSGYLRTLPPPGRARLAGADAMHAWVNVWCGQALGWIGFDPTNACRAGEDHIPIGMGRDYADVAPFDGTFIGNAPQTMRSAVDVTAAL